MCALSWAALSAIFAQSQWVQYVNPKGDLLAYKVTPAGDHIMDFSSAGYMGGGVAFPDAPVVKTVRPLSNGADDTDAIQAALDEVARLPLRKGVRGAVLLAPGKFICSRALRMTADGVVLRGSGSEGGNASVIWMNGEEHSAIEIGAREGGGRARERRRAPEAVRTAIADDYMPAGAEFFTVVSARGFAPGDLIEIRRKTTSEWVRLMRMDTLKRDGKPQTWIGAGREQVHTRRIVAVEGERIAVDAPLSDSFDARYFRKGDVAVVRVESGKKPVNAGVEHLRIECPPLEIDYGRAPYSAARIDGEDCWMDDVRCIETMNTTAITGRRVTLRGVHVTHTFPNLGASKPADFSIEGSQILVDRCSSAGGNTYWVWTSSLVTGPNVVLNSDFTGRGSRIQPHQRWSTGLLVDNCRAPDGGIDFSNRGVAGSGHGWTMGWAVAWNCTAKTYIIQNPPGARNWAIGCVGGRLRNACYFDTAPLEPEGVFESHGAHVAPRSLYLAQMLSRLGPVAVAAIGYGPGSDAALALENPKMLAVQTQSAPIDVEFGEDLAFLRPVNTSGVRVSDSDDPRKFGGEKALDGNPQTYWSPGDSAGAGAGRARRVTLEIDTEGPLDINALTLSEPAAFANVRAYKIEGQVDSDWTLLAEGATIGDRRTHTFARLTVWKVRLTVLKSDGPVCIGTFSLHCKP